MLENVERKSIKLPRKNSNGFKIFQQFTPGKVIKAKVLTENLRDVKNIGWYLRNLDKEFNLIDKVERGTYQLNKNGEVALQTIEN